MAEIEPVNNAELDAFRRTFPDPNEVRFDDDCVRWFITTALYLVARSGRQAEMIDVMSWTHHLERSIINKEYALSEKVDLKRPIIIAAWEDNRGQIILKLIDGMHRLYKAYKTGVAQLPAYVLTVDEGKLCYG